MKSPWAIATAVALISGPVMASSAIDHAHSHRHGEAAAKYAKPGKITRTVNVTMHDAMRFDPPSIKVKVGETIRFRLKNAGGVPHEMVIGSKDDLHAHAQTMRAGAPHGVGHGDDHGAGNTGHDESAGLLLAPRKQGDLVYTFKHKGSVDFACLVPGHFEAGMAGKITIN
jgi:uncharacterized cupredoxin-like copper-binding protein